MSNVAQDCPAYKLLLEQAIAHQMPTCFAGDLVHDLDCMMGQPSSRPFLWLLRECGTHLFYGRHPASLESFFQYEKRRFYVWTGTSLLPFETPEAACMTFAELRSGR